MRQGLLTACSPEHGLVIKRSVQVKRLRELQSEDNDAQTLDRGLF